MEDVLITSIVFFAIYKTIELLVLQKERKLMISRMNAISPEMMQSNLGSLQAAQSNKFRNNPFLMLRLGAVALGVGFGWIIGLILAQPNLGIEFGRGEKDSVFIATTAFCAGIALIIVYIIEQKAIKDAKKGEK